MLLSPRLMLIDSYEPICLAKGRHFHLHFGHSQNNSIMVAMLEFGQLCRRHLDIWPCVLPWLRISPEKAALMQKKFTKAKTEAPKPNIIELRGQMKYDVSLGRRWIWMWIWMCKDVCGTHGYVCAPRNDYKSVKK